MLRCIVNNMYVTYYNLQRLNWRRHSLKKTILIALIVVGILSLFAINTSWFSFFQDESKANVSNNTNEIIIESDGINVEVEPKDQQYVTAEVSGKGVVKVLEDGNTIKVKYARKWYQSFFSFFDKSKLTITIPKTYDNDLRFHVGSGLVHFKDSSNMTFGHFAIDLGSGKIDIGDITANTGEIDIRSGMTTIQTFTGNLDIDVSSGMFKLHNMKGNLDTNVSSGKVTIAVEQLTDSIDAQVSSGMLTLDLPEDADFTLKGNVSSGIIRNHFKLEHEKTTKKSFEGRYGKGTHPIDLKVSSGVIEIE